MATCLALGPFRSKGGTKKAFSKRKSCLRVPLATPWWRHVGWETARRREVSAMEQKTHHQSETALGGENCLRVGGLLLLGCARGLSMKAHMCPCKQDRGWSPSTGQDCLHSTMCEVKHDIHMCQRQQRAQAAAPAALLFSSLFLSFTDDGTIRPDVSKTL